MLERFSVGDPKCFIQKFTRKVLVRCGISTTQASGLGNLTYLKPYHMIWQRISSGFEFWDPRPRVMGLLKLISVFTAKKQGAPAPFLKSSSASLIRGYWKSNVVLGFSTTKIAPMHPRSSKRHAVLADCISLPKICTLEPALSPDPPKP